MRQGQAGGKLKRGHPLWIPKVARKFKQKPFQSGRNRIKREMKKKQGSYFTLPIKSVVKKIEK